MEGDVTGEEIEELRDLIFQLEAAEQDSVAEGDAFGAAIYARMASEYRADLLELEG